MIASAGDKLWKELVGNGAKMNISHIALGFTGIDVAEAGQQSIENFLKSGNHDKRLREMDGFENGPVGQADSSLVIESTTQDLPSITYTCPKCGKKLTVFLDSDVMEDSDPLKMVRMEHEDFHFAQELAKDSERASKPRDRSPKKGTTHKSAKRRRIEPKGIERFFLKK